MKMQVSVHPADSVSSLLSPLAYYFRVLAFIPDPRPPRPCSWLPHCFLFHPSASLASSILHTFQLFLIFCPVPFFLTLNVTKEPKSLWPSREERLQTALINEPGLSCLRNRASPEGPGQPGVMAQRVEAAEGKGQSPSPPHLRHLPAKLSPQLFWESYSCTGQSQSMSKILPTNTCFLEPLGRTGGLYYLGLF